MEPGYQSIAKLTCGQESGTAFLIAPEKALTTRHTVDDYLADDEKIQLFFPDIGEIGVHVEAKVIFPDEPYIGEDVAILELNTPITEIEPLILCGSPVSPSDNWRAFGFPTSKRDLGEVFYGTVTQAYIKRRDEGQYDIDLACIHPNIVDPNYITEGASGSPIFKNNEVIGVLSDKSPGNSIGGVSVISFQHVLDKESIPLNTSNCYQESSYPKNTNLSTTEPSLFNSKLEKTVVKVKLNPIEERMIQVKETVISLIEDFPPDAHLILQQSLNQIIQDISSKSSSILEDYLHKYRFPFTLDHENDIGLEQLLEILMLIKCTFPKVEIFGDDLTANICIDEQSDLFALVVHAVKRHTKMPQIVLEITRRIQNTPTGKKMIRRGEQLLPYPLILDNCSGHRKVNLCHNCQSEFLFENVLRDFCVGEEEGYFTGIEQNNFGLLSESKVICADCLRNINNEVIDSDELLKRIKEMLT